MSLLTLAVFFHSFRLDSGQLHDGFVRFRYLNLSFDPKEYN